jgi:hypothetical protein
MLEKWKAEVLTNFLSTPPGSIQKVSSIAGIGSRETALHAGPCPQRRLSGEKFVNQPAHHPA